MVEEGRGGTQTLLINQQHMYQAKAYWFASTYPSLFNNSSSWLEKLQKKEVNHDSLQQSTDIKFCPKNHKETCNGSSRCDRISSKHAAGIANYSRAQHYDKISIQVPKSIHYLP